jgi:hypothetical protein
MCRRKRKLSDFNAEIEAHLRLEVERLREQGLSADDARAAMRGGRRKRLSLLQKAVRPDLSRGEK